MLSLLLLAGYALLEHLSVALHEPVLGLAALVVLIVLVLLGPLRQARVWAFLVVIGLVALLALEPVRAWAPAAFFISPVAINLGLGWLFGHTLARGQTPLVARMVRLLHARDGVPDPAVWGYARSVTVCWTALFAFNALTCLALALFARPDGLLERFGVQPGIGIPLEWWSFHANIGCYVLVGALFGVEYAVRRRRFPWQPFTSLVDFLQQLGRLGPAIGEEIRAERLARARGASR
jgi:uncharacterized membrane protein